MRPAVTPIPTTLLRLAAGEMADLLLASHRVVPASIAKVAGSETLDFVLDENIQIHGGNGYVRDYPAERHYRDARVNRIFEGTNEINRLLIPGMLARRAVKGDLGIIPAAKALQDELLGPPSVTASGDGPLADERRAVDAFKKAERFPNPPIGLMDQHGLVRLPFAFTLLAAQGGLRLSVGPAYLPGSPAQRGF